MAPRKRQAAAATRSNQQKRRRRAEIIEENLNQVIEAVVIPEPEPEATPARRVTRQRQREPRTPRFQQQQQRQDAALPSERRRPNPVYPLEAEVNIIEPTPATSTPRRQQHPQDINVNSTGGSNNYNAGTTLNNASITRETPVENAMLLLSETLIETMNVIREGASIRNFLRTSEQHEVDRKLPEFSGRPLQWLHFYKTYEETADLFSARRNISRLEKALSGEARKLVKTLLSITDSPTVVVDELKKHFGNKFLIAKDIVKDLHSLPCLKSGKSNLSVFATQLKSGVEALQALNMSEYLSSIDLLMSVVNKIPEDMKSTYYRYVDSAMNLPADASLLQKLTMFLSKESDMAMRAGIFDIEMASSKSGNESGARKHAKTTRSGVVCTTINGAVESSNDKIQCRCQFCDRSNHDISACEKFQKETSNRRWSFIKRMKLCFKCLGTGHRREQCQSRIICDICQKNHHTRLHTFRNDKNRNYSDDKKGRDNERKEHPSSRQGRDKLRDHTQVPRLELPRQSLSIEVVQRVKRILDIELHPFENVRLGIIIGQNNWPLIECDEVLRVENTGFVISHTHLGWSLHGYIEEKSLRSDVLVHFSCFTKNDVKLCDQERLFELDNIVHRYLEYESLGIEQAKPSQDKNERAIAILEATTRKTGSEWETGLLWKEGLMPELNSRATALRRLYSLERKLDNNPSFATRYYKEMERLIENGYVEKVKENVRRPRVWFVPHFGVENPNKPDKVRLIFDAAARTGGVSMNDLLETGPGLLESLVGVLLRFRQHAIAVKADIKDMYLRIKLIERDRGAQRFLWRGANRSCEPSVWENVSLIFGSKSSPCSAIYVKNKNAERFALEKPEAVRSIIKNSYMDDYLASGKSAEEMRERVRNVIAINREANFNMHGWASNDPNVINDVHDDYKSKLARTNLCNNDERVLGLYWDRMEDTFSFNVGLEKIRAELLRGDAIPTKREVSSIVMSVYDPLGIISPFTIQAKLILQDVWRSAVGWDERIRDDEFEFWLIWLRNLPRMQVCKISRYLRFRKIDAQTQLHTFTDASTKAYATVAYLRIETNNGDVQLSLVMAKARVAPKKPMTIPRLELQAALLGTKIAATIEQELDIKIGKRVFWSDSSTVLHWIRGEPREKQVFVANRLGQIGELSKVSEWRWVPTKLNPADDATRQSNKPMLSEDRWFIGPEFLRERPESWPKEKALQACKKQKIDEQESRKAYIGATFITEPTKWEVPLELRILGWSRIVRTMQSVRKFFFIWKQKSREKRVQTNRRSKTRTHNSSPQNANESTKNGLEAIFEAEKTWFRLIQSAHFPRELETLQKGKELHRGSKLINIQPYIDKHGLLRARGRVSKFCSTHFQNQPIILDAKHYATKLLIAEFHRKFDHANNENVINELRQQFYIVGLRTRLRWLAKNCVTCRLRRAKPMNPPMADLPTCRLASGLRPFTHCGIDYFGPMEVKIGRRREKRWGVLFTCMTTRAIHVEIAHTLNASSTIMAIQRLGGRRGCPREIYSDNGTNFVRANKELAEEIKSLDIRKQKQFAESRRIKWHFNPPDAPHMGGAWERLIRSVKVALKHALNEHAPSEEVLVTLLIEIEHMVNSRPMTHVSVDPQDEEALTPNHFLFGSSSGHVQIDRYEAETLNPRKTYEIAQHLANGFWKRWLREYLPTLLPRQKWNTSVPALKVGDIVLITDYQAPRNTWKKGKVVEIYRNTSDQVVRIVKVRAGKKDFVRPVNKLVKIFSPLQGV
ncbi:uncharacterized protein LOC131675118 [Phymastichus coffea]|uniref:uncharacterized protein LOC131675118 n=1 Tax=Phymastichus coffea TaxID=108790 RepID=UPI00273BB41B|nr:uncharacterized protein LOC131675118 [Phymastichus coffea]